MNKQIRTKLQFILGGILLVTFAVAGCNNGDADKTTTTTETKTTVTEQPRDSMDTGDKAPIVDPK